MYVDTDLCNMFANYPWLAYSKSENGGYCACCMAFASSIHTGGKFGALVESPLTKFKKALETLASHEKTECHKDSYAKMVAFLESASKGQSVVAQLNTLHAAHIQKKQVSFEIDHICSRILQSSRNFFKRSPRLCKVP